MADLFIILMNIVFVTFYQIIFRFVCHSIQRYCIYVYLEYTQLEFMLLSPLQKRLHAFNIDARVIPVSFDLRKKIP